MSDSPGPARLRQLAARRPDRPHVWGGVAAPRHVGGASRPAARVADGGLDLAVCNTGACAVRIHNGGITGPAFFDHVRRSRRPIINSPKGQTTPLPPDLVRRSVTAPQVYWTWTLVWRRDEERAAVLAAADALTDKVGDLGICWPDAWLPDTVPLRQ